jgi:hypothetical protein
MNDPSGNLSPKATALLELGRPGDDPTDVEVTANRHAIVAKLGAAALGAGATVSVTNQAAAATSAATWTTTKVVISCGVLAIGGAATWGAVQYAGGLLVETDRTVPAQVRPLEEPVATGSERAAASATPIDPVAPVQLAAPVASTVSTPGTVSASKTTGASPLPSIGDELHLVRGAQQHLNRGEPAAALSLLAEHARRFPSGVLREEREASRVLALCGMGKREAARALANDFIRLAPRSPFVDRVRDACRETPAPGSP